MKYYILLASLLFLSSSSCVFTSGSYPYAERYKFDVSCDELIEKIQKFKDNNPEYKVFQTNENGEIYEPGGFYVYTREGNKIITKARNDSSIFYSFYFNIPDIKATIHCVINVSKLIDPDLPTILKLTGLTYSTNFGWWWSINTKDISGEENKTIKNKFETEILDNLEIPWQRDKWWK